ncbi:MAG: helix-hairpin-helix domain-containing protein [Planctomycetota bacterium]|nr:helix-hairpin-helix domain-containing protein [Planctomycetota bacterium]
MTTTADPRRKEKIVILACLFVGIGAVGMKAFRNWRQSSMSFSLEQVERKVNLNSAPQWELEVLPAIGPGRAVKIVEYRKSGGKFHSVEDLSKLDDRISDRNIDAIRPHVIFADDLSN